MGKKTFLVGILKATDEKSRIRIRKSVVRIRECRYKMSRIHNTGNQKLKMFTCDCESEAPKNWDLRIYPLPPKQGSFWT